MKNSVIAALLLAATAPLFAAPHHALQEFMRDVDRGAAVMDRIVEPGYLSDSTGEIQITRDVQTLRGVRAVLDAEALAAVREAKGQDLRRAIKDYYAAASAYLADPSPTNPAEVLVRLHAREEFTKAQKLLQLEAGQ